MSFADKLQNAFSEEGGLTRENRERICNLAREIQEDITPRYLTRLLLGIKPRPQDYQAFAIAFGKPPDYFADDRDGFNEGSAARASMFAIERMKRPDLVGEFVGFVLSKTSFRNEVIDYRDLYKLAKEFLLSKGLDQNFD